MLAKKIKSAYGNGGFSLVIYKVVSVTLRKIKEFFITLYFRLIPSKRFQFRGKTYRCLYHVYNKTWQNERAVEVPIIWEFVKTAKTKRVLEVGNVLRNYFFGCRHDVIDKYEEGKGIVNADVVDFKPTEKYGLIVSISTMEHVGWDEEEKDPVKIARGFDNLSKNCLAKDGVLVFTAPLGYNRYLDSMIRNGELKFSEMYFLKRISSENEWREVSYDEVRNASYGRPFPNANAIIVGITQKFSENNRNLFAV